MGRFFAISVLILGTISVSRAAPREPFEMADWPIPANAVDKVVVPLLEKRGAKLALPCSDAVYLRRIYLDLLGTVPEPGELESFVADTSPGKRAALVEKLFEREEFVEYSALHWADLLRVKAEFPINLWPNAVQAYYRWIQDAIRHNMPYDEFAHALLTGGGSNFRQPESNFYRAMEARDPSTIARTVAMTWMGLGGQSLSPPKLKDMQAFFDRVGYKRTMEWKEEIVILKPAQAPVQTRFPDGKAVTLAAEDDPRAVFADWLVRKENPWFARAAVNRVWYWLMGRAIIEPVDSLGEAPLPSRSALLDFLAAEFSANKYDMRALYRLVLGSRVYQQSSLQTDPPGLADLQYARYAIRRLHAEVLIDAINRLGGGGESYYSAIPEPFTFIPPSNRSISLSDGSITSSFLMRFGRPSRDSGRASERNGAVDEEQLRYLINSSELQRKITQSPRLQEAYSMPANKSGEQVRMIYEQVLSRPPTEEELRNATALMKASRLSLKQKAQDLAWALVNGKEFLYRH